MVVLFLPLLVQVSLFCIYFLSFKPAIYCLNSFIAIYEQLDRDNWHDNMLILMSSLLENRLRECRRSYVPSNTFFDLI